VIQGMLIIVSCGKVLVGNTAGRTVAIGIQNHDAVTQFPCGHDEVAAQLAAAQQA
jgi:hypothetical protein